MQVRATRGRVPAARLLGATGAVARVQSRDIDGDVMGRQAAGSVTKRLAT